MKVIFSNVYSPHFALSCDGTYMIVSNCCISPVWEMSQLDVHLSFLWYTIFCIFCIFHWEFFSILCHLDVYGIFNNFGIFLEHSAFVGTHSEFAEIGHFLFH